MKKNIRRIQEMWIEEEEEERVGEGPMISSEILSVNTSENAWQAHSRSLLRGASSIKAPFFSPPQLSILSLINSKYKITVRRGSATEWSFCSGELSKNKLFKNNTIGTYRTAFYFLPHSKD